MELLESRRVLASVLVDNSLDVVNGDTSSITNLLGNDGGDGVSLREAILAANQTSGPDTVEFDVQGVFAAPQEIALTSGQMDISEDLTVDGPGSQLLTVNAQLNSRIFSITAATGNYTFRGLTLTNGRTTGGEHGGAIRSATSGDVFIEASVITGNSTTGNFANGGGIYTNGNLTLTGSAVTLNTTAGTQAAGGGIYVANDYLSLYDSTVNNNSTIGNESSGGGISTPNSSVTLTRSTVSGNSTAGPDAVGGGIQAYYTTLVGSTVSGNQTTAASAHGGGIFGYQVTLYNSTVSGNSTSGNGSNGGGIAVDEDGTITLAQSTVTSNQVTHSSAVGGGLFADNGSVVLTGTIVSANGAAGSNPDISASGGSIQANYSLIGTAITPTSGSNNVMTDSPQIGALTNNGGNTETHELIAGSPAINASDPSAVLGIGIYAFVYDQRGNNFGRLQGGRVDIGAFEVGDPPSADFESDGLVTGIDFLLWQRGVGTVAPNAMKIDGDADNDLDSDSSDLAVWELQYGGSELISALSISDVPEIPEVANSAAFTGPVLELDSSRSTGDGVRRSLDLEETQPLRAYESSPTEFAGIDSPSQTQVRSVDFGKTNSKEKSEDTQPWLEDLDVAFATLDPLNE